VCVGRIAEAKDMADALGDIRGRVAVLTSNDEANALSGADPDQAQILITTQQRIERATDRRTFGAAAAFLYRGAVRAVRVWDESWLPGVPIAITGDDLGFLPKLIRPRSPECADAVMRFAEGLSRVADGDLVDVPDFEATYGVSLYEILADTVEKTGRTSDDQKATTTALIALNGRTARAHRDNRNSRTILTYHDTLPDDLLPLLVLDASGRVRTTYEWMERGRGIVRLREAVKDYSPLTVYAWRTSGSKSGFAQNGSGLVKGITETILRKPDDRWLVVVHKSGDRSKDADGDAWQATGGTYGAAIRRLLPKHVSENVAIITWGRHMATNEFKDVANVILAGTLFMRESWYVALTHLAQDRDVVPGFASRAEVVETMKGEHAHLAMQAVCRGRVRKSDGAHCQSMTAYIIASPRSGIPKDLARIYPGCRVRPWNPLQPPLRGKLKAAVEYVKEAMARGETWIPLAKIRNAVRMSAKDWRRRITKSAGWKQAIADLGLATTKGHRGALGLTRAAS